MNSPPHRRFVRFAPGKIDPGVQVAVRVTDMSAADAAWWDRRFGPYHLRLAGRADRFWPWSVLLPACHLIQTSKQRSCRPLVIWARADNQQFVRSAMSILIERYVHLDEAHPAEAHFVWFMCAADKRVLAEHFHLANPPSLGAVLLDSAMVLSENAGLEGRIGLHAAASGGTKLLGFYRNAGLQQLSASARLPSPIKRANDGRFFYAAERAAAALLAKLDHLR